MTVKNEETEATEFCEICGKKLDPNKIVWLNLDRRTNTYTDKELPSQYSQGGFPFGKDCAKRILKVKGST